MTGFLLESLNDGTLELVRYRGEGGAVTVPPGSPGSGITPSTTASP